MQCPECSSTHIRKNGSRKGKQRYICADCQRQFLSVYEPLKGYSNDLKRECLELYLNGMGFRAIERVKHVHHTTIIYWVKQLGSRLPDTPAESNIPEVGELDELQTFVGSKKTKSGCGLP
jgi:transposase-like protein